MSEHPPNTTDLLILQPPTAVVGMGGSAGALDGYERFFLGIAPTCGLAFVVVPHLDPQSGGLMPGILQRYTSMPVVQAEEGMALQANCMYVLAPGFSLTINGGLLHLEALELANGRVIDRFFSSLATDQRERAVAIVLSGMGDDGTRGTEAIRANGGRVFIEDPDTAEYPAMPRSAAETTVADDMTANRAAEVLPVQDIAARLMSLYTRHPDTRHLEHLS